MSTILLILTAVTGADGATEPAAALQQAQALVGQWRGVGQVRRGSTRGAWQVQGEWRWDFQDHAKLKYVAKDGKYIKAAELTAAPAASETEREGGEETLRSRLALTIDGRPFSAETPTDSAPASGAGSQRAVPETLSFVAGKPLENGLARVSLRLVAGGDRLVMRLERRRPSGRYSLLGEVGYTRVGSQFGKGKSHVECVVTGGLGTIPVSYQGQTYYVCCTGCKEYFDEHPAAVLEAYRERLAEREEKRRKEQQQADDGRPADDK